MFPVLLEIGPIKIYSFGFMLVIAFYTCYFLQNSDLKRFGYAPKLASDMVFWAAIGGLFGAKIYYLIETLPSGQAADNINGLIKIIAGIIKFFIGIITLSMDKIVASGQQIGIGIQNFGAGLVFLGGLIGGLITVSLCAFKNILNWFLIFFLFSLSSG